MVDRENHDHFQHDLSFSEYGDIDRMTGDGTSARSREANAMAREAEQNIDFGRAFPVAGSGGTVGNDGVMSHAYGDS